jgi:hypothetical protein
MTVEPGPFREERRPFPDPEHRLTPRKPRTVGGFVYLVVLGTAGVGLALIAFGPFRTGLAVMGAGLVVGAIGRLVIPADRAGMLGIRRKLVDVTTLLLLGGGLFVLAVVIPDRPPI